MGSIVAVVYGFDSCTSLPRWNACGGIITIVYDCLKKWPGLQGSAALAAAIKYTLKIIYV